MEVFGAYAKYYDLFYGDKNYDGEAAFVLSLLEEYGKKPRNLLDLGCGTGRHALALAKLGIAVEGVDLSETMLDMGRARIQSLGEKLASPPLLHHGDARNVRLGKAFDAAISLFHVLSYQTEEEDALDFLRAAAAHLSPGGLFLADFWFGPCVLHLRPEKRLKTMEDAHVRVSRGAAPRLDIERDIVTVHYDIRLESRDGDQAETFSEDHRMRYWFLPELHYLAGLAGFTAIAHGAWMSRSKATDKDWAAWMLFQKC